MTWRCSGCNAYADQDIAGIFLQLYLCYITSNNITLWEKSVIGCSITLTCNLHHKPLTKTASMAHVIHCVDASFGRLTHQYARRFTSHLCQCRLAQLKKRHKSLLCSSLPQDTTQDLTKPHKEKTHRALDLGQELLQGQLLSQCTAVPQVPWGPLQLVQVLGVGMVLLVLGILLPALGPSSLLPGTPDWWNSTTAGRQDATLHFLRETFLLATSVLVLSSILGPTQPRSKGLFQYGLSAHWAPVTLGTCLIVFPLVDPVLTNTWTGLLSQVFGPDVATATAGTALAVQVKDTVTDGDWGSLGLHLAASGLIGPMWEETFWRGFFLTSLTRVLPPTACVVVSSTLFALLHLTPATFPAIWALAAVSDVLYLRSGSLGAPLLLHCLWNGSQLLAVALLDKDAFV